MTIEEFERLLNPIFSQAYGYALRLERGNIESASDLLQDAAIAAFRGRHTFTAGTHFKAWFFKVLTHQFYRSHSRKQLDVVSLDDDAEPYLYNMVASQGLGDALDPAEVLFDKMDREMVVRALDELPDEFREASLLYFMGEMSYEEIAQTLEIPIGTVRSRLHRGRKLLQQSLWKLAESRGLVEEISHV